MSMLGADLVNIRIGLLPLVALGLLIAGCTSRSRLGSPSLPNRARYNRERTSAA